MSSASLRPVVVCTAVLLLGAALRAEQTTASLAGVVTDQTGAAVAGAAVEVRLGGTLAGSATSDREGRYRVDGLAAGS